MNNTDNINNIKNIDNIDNIIIIIGLLLILLILVIINKNKSEKFTVAKLTNLSKESLQNMKLLYDNSDNEELIYNKIKCSNILETSIIEAENFKNIIVMWSGKETEIPEGWVLCDGNNGTPDLRGRFVLGLGTGNRLTERRLNEIGGEEEVKLKIEELPIHRHNWVTVHGDDDDEMESINYKYAGDGGKQKEINLYRNHKGDSAYDDKVRDRITSKEGYDKYHNNMPPYYVLAYIMRK